MRRIISGQGRRYAARTNGWTNFRYSPKVDFRNPRSRGKPTLVLGIVAAECFDIIERPGLAAHDPIAGREIGVAASGRLGSNIAS